MSAFIRARQARIVAGLFSLSIVSATFADDAMAGVLAAKPPGVGASTVSAIPPAIEPPVHYFSINRVLAEHDRKAAFSGAAKLTSFRETTIVEQALPSAKAESDEPFGLFTFRAPEGLLWAKWRGVETAIDEEAGTLAQCRHNVERCSSSAALRFLAMIDEAQKWAGREKLDAVNRMMNSAIVYTSDLAQHGVADLWSAPLETLASGRGDCEDYAIAKYVLLRESGVATQDLRLLLVRDRSIGQDHAVLAVREADHWLILDNRWTALTDSSEARHLTPLFAIDHRGVRLFAAPYAARLPEEGERDGVSPASEGRRTGEGNLPSPM
jgi:predicted transglutaminase-like cysteine proteinase